MAAEETQQTRRRLAPPLLRFDQIVGQEQAIEQVRKSVESGRLHHALLLHGPPGVGKATFALALAAAFVCPACAALMQERKFASGCGKCPSCSRVGAETHPDVHWLCRAISKYYGKSETKGTTITVDAARGAFIARAGQRSVEGVGKVFVIDEAEKASDEANNAMLKTLEEPEGRTLIMLVSSRPWELPATVRSRCTLVRFLPIAGDVITGRLVSQGVAEPLAKTLSTLSEGSLGTAIGWTRSVVAQHGPLVYNWASALAAGDERAAGSDCLPDAVAAITEERFKTDPSNTEESEDQARRNALRLVLQFAGQGIRKVMQARAEAGVSAVATSRGIDVLQTASTYIESNVSTAVILQYLAIELPATLLPTSGSGRPSGTMAT